MDSENAVTNGIFVLMMRLSSFSRQLKAKKDANVANRMLMNLFLILEMLPGCVLID